jgi:stage IV sporulation protein FB
VTKPDIDPWEKRPASAWRDVWDRMVGQTEDPVGWGFGLGRISGVRVRVSLWFVVFAVGQIVWSISFSNVGPMYAVLAMAALFFVAAVHEFGHVVACRLVGGRAEEVLLWPVGGLGWFETGPRWTARLATALGGWWFQGTLFGVTSLVLWQMGHADLILFNVLDGLGLYAGEFVTWWGVLLWWVHSMNVVVMLLNVLPMLPLDGARVLEGLLSRKKLDADIRWVISQFGLVVALGIVVISLPTGQTMLLGLGVCSALVCWSERQRVRAVVELAEHVEDVAGDSEDVEIAPLGEMRREKREAQEQEEADEILSKIAREGIESLTGSDRKLLDRVSRRKQQESD